jgi:hypothetical protein
MVILFWYLFVTVITGWNYPLASLRDMQLLLASTRQGLCLLSANFDLTPEKKPRGDLLGGRTTSDGLRVVGLDEVKREMEDRMVDEQEKFGDRLDEEGNDRLKEYGKVLEGIMKGGEPNSVKMKEQNGVNMNPKNDVEKMYDDEKQNKSQDPLIACWFNEND